MAPNHTATTFSVLFLNPVKYGWVSKAKLSRTENKKRMRYKDRPQEKDRFVLRIL